MRRAIVWTALMTALAGCTAPTVVGEPPVITPVSVVSQIPRVASLSAVVREIPADGVAGTPTGVAIEPDTRRRVVLTREGVVYELGTGAILWRATLAEDPFGFTDLIALGEGRLALTSVGDGFLVELATGSMAQHFCYEPGWMEPQGENPVQVSFAVARDPIAGRIYAQPRTFQQGGFGEITESFVAAYDEAIGSDLAWWSMPDLGFGATGMIVLPGASADAPRLVLASGSTLHRFDVASAALTPASDLAALGITDIAGLAFDDVAGTVLVLDGPSGRVLEVRASALDLGID
jgi:hypothetical protein